MDVTQHLAGSFFVPAAKKEKHAELRKVMEEYFDMPFVDNGNSMSTCFQFENHGSDKIPGLRIKYYFKTLELL